ncbi:MAG: ParB/RepB/Spo0J family partition protein [Ignavibacteria bacterium]|nr:ParB/RepB/Spo0J family partition protein [Ignavibacteria bacterium]
MGKQLSSNTIQMLPIGKLIKSPTNPRKYFNDKELTELAESIKNVGLQQAIKVRPIKDSKYEIIFGERRYRAFLLNKSKEIPCIVEELTDEQVLDIQTIENLQRSDIHPLDEAEGFKLLRRKMTIEQICAKISKSVDYVYKRIRLADLIQPLKAAMYDNAFPVSYALLICGYPPISQEEIYKRIKNENNNTKLDPALLPAYTEFKDDIISDFNNELSQYSFDKLDDTLNSKRNVKCSVCSFNTANDLVLFDTSKESYCANSECLRMKVITDIQRKIKASTEKLIVVADEWYIDNIHPDYKKAFPTILNTQKYNKAKPNCKSTEKGIILIGNKHNKTLAGSVIKICLDKKCKVCNANQHTSYSSGSTKTAAERKQANTYSDERKIRMQELNNIRDKLTEKVMHAFMNRGGMQKDILISAILTKGYDMINKYQADILCKVTTLPPGTINTKAKDFEYAHITIPQLQKMSPHQLNLLFLVNYLTKFRFKIYQDYERYKSDIGTKRDRLKFYADIYLTKDEIKAVEKEFTIPRKAAAKTKSKKQTKAKKKK